jgi:Mrp family chromosome partitioning ATPase
MAMTQAHEYQRMTVLIDLDLERPSLAEVFGLSAVPGVAEVLRGQVAPTNCLQQVDETLTVMTAGSDANASKHLLRGTAASLLFDQLESRCEVIVADLPPLIPGSGAAHLADLCGTVAIVVRSGFVDREEVADAVACLPGPVYAVVNDLRPKTPRLLRRILGQDR